LLVSVKDIRRQRRL